MCESRPAAVTDRPILPRRARRRWRRRTRRWRRHGTAPGRSRPSRWWRRGRRCWKTTIDPLRSGYLIAPGIHALHVSHIVPPLRLLSRVLGGAGPGRGSYQEATTRAGRRAERRVARCGTERRAGSGAHGGTDRRARDSTPCRGFPRRHPDGLKSPLPAHHVVIVELFQGLPGARQHHHARARRHRRARAEQRHQDQQSQPSSGHVRVPRHLTESSRGRPGYCLPQSTLLRSAQAHPSGTRCRPPLSPTATPGPARRFS
jgi:hypothetical protein